MLIPPIPSLREVKRKIKDILVECNSVPRKRKLDADKYLKVYMEECLKAKEVPPIDFGDDPIDDDDIFITRHNEYRRRTRLLLRMKCPPKKTKNRWTFQNLKENQKCKCKCMDISNCRYNQPEGNTKISPVIMTRENIT